MFLKPCLMVVAALLMLLMVSCSDDESSLPSYVTDLVEANTDATGVINTIRTDDGTIYHVGQQISTSVADTTWRCLATYTVDNDAMTLYSVKAIFSALPKEASEFKSLPRDPVKFISAWRTDRYINLRLGIMTTDGGGHAFGFCEDSIAVSSNGIRTAYLTLLHKRPDQDAESYTDEQFLSIPLAHYTECDSFEINITTYEGEHKVKGL